MNYAECISVAGSLDAFDSILQCTISEVATSDISGTVELPFVFNVGGSSSASDLEAAKSLSAGIQTISFTSGDGTILSYDVTFDAGSPSPDDPDDIVFVARSLEWDSTNDYYLLGGNCPTSYGFGKLSLTVDDGTLNCDTWEAKITNDLNDWYLPKSAQSFGSISLESCSGNEIVVNYANVPAGYRVFLDVIGSPDGFNIGATYSDEHTCGAAVSGGSSSTFVTTNSAGESVTGTAVVVVTSDITVTVTEPCSQYGTTVVTTLPNGQATTQSAEVIVSTNSGGSLYTTTSIIAGPTEYTTTIVTTDIVGVPCTETGVVIVSSSEGELYTITS
ncbi:cell-wall agglutinin N-terminal ligand-sugar binding-domain-containing protein, partial [Scheffersomyces coipomensis]|uniref:cell-wall agglutinin N-terminal ligand-sugar binding-domain-containing protein n=1 Tax=Scheffersomyces coipomensis TaxID=1788519 RepID=UPI00315DC989